MSCEGHAPVTSVHQHSGQRRARSHSANGQVPAAYGFPSCYPIVSDLGPVLGGGGIPVDETEGNNIEIFANLVQESSNAKVIDMIPSPPSGH